MDDAEMALHWFWMINAIVDILFIIVFWFCENEKRLGGYWVVSNPFMLGVVGVLGVIGLIMTIVSISLFVTEHS